MKNKITKQYLREVRHLFPIWGKEEKNYLKTFQQNLEDFTEATSDFALQDLYQQIGEPKDILSEYLSQADTQYLSKKLRLNYIVKKAICVFVVSFVVICGIWSYVLIWEYLHFDDSSVSYEETIIE